MCRAVGSPPAGDPPWSPKVLPLGLPGARTAASLRSACSTFSPGSSSSTSLAAGAGGARVGWAAGVRTQSGCQRLQRLQRQRLQISSPVQARIGLPVPSSPPRPSPALHPFHLLSLHVGLLSLGRRICGRTASACEEERRPGRVAGGHVCMVRGAHLHLHTPHLRNHLCGRHPPHLPSHVPATARPLPHLLQAGEAKDGDGGGGGGWAGGSEDRALGHLDAAQHQQAWSRHTARLPRRVRGLGWHSLASSSAHASSSSSTLYST